MKIQKWACWKNQEETLEWVWFLALVKKLLTGQVTDLELHGSKEACVQMELLPWADDEWRQEKSQLEESSIFCAVSLQQLYIIIPSWPSFYWPSACLSVVALRE